MAQSTETNRDGLHIRHELTSATSRPSMHGRQQADPTLGDTYELLMTYSARTVEFLHEQMANAHCLPDPWDEACLLETAMIRTAHLFYCLWQSEGDPVRFENIREWATIVYTDARTKLTAIKLFVKLERRRRQRKSNGPCTARSEPCNDAPVTLNIPTKYDPVPREPGHAGPPYGERNHKQHEATCCARQTNPRHASDQTRGASAKCPGTGPPYMHEEFYRVESPIAN